MEVICHDGFGAIGIPLARAAARPMMERNWNVLRANSLSGFKNWLPERDGIFLIYHRRRIICQRRLARAPVC